jgi:uncharacterized delta-60 repeat protein
MADLKISDLPASGAMAGGELLPVVQGGATKKATVASLGPALDNIPNAALDHSTVTVNGTAIPLGGSATVTAVNPNALTLGAGLTGTSYDGSAAVTAAVDATDASTASKVVSRDGSGASSFDAVKFDGATSGTVTVQAAAAAGTWTLTLPTTDGDAGQVLTTNGSGVASWAAVGQADSAITPTTLLPYSITTADVGKRLMMNSTTTGVVRFDNANTSAIAVGSTVGLVSLGAGTVLNVPIGTPVAAPNLDVYGIAVQSDGKIILVGTFTTVGGTTRNRIARLNADGTLDTGYNPNANGQVFRVALQSDGKALVGGNFTTVGGTARNRVARLNTDGTLDTGYNPNADNVIYAIALQSDGKAVIVGDFTTVGGTGRNRVARLNTDGTLDTGYNPNANGNVSAVALQSDGKAVIVGTFTTVGGTARNRIARLNTDGTLDTGYNPNADSNTTAIGIQPSDDKAIVSGAFTNIGGAARTRVARLNTDGTADTGWTTTLSSSAEPNAIIFQSDGKAVIGGNFTTVSGTTRNRIVRLNTDGTLDTGYNPDANQTVRSIAISGTNHLVGGFFTTIGGLTSNYLVAVPATTITFDTIRAPYASATTLDQYTVLTLEKITSTEWLITASNDS